MSLDIVKFVFEQQPLFTSALSDQRIVWQKESQFAIQCFQKSKYLSDTAFKNPSSAQNAIINVAAIGITLNPSAKLAYLVPRDGAVCLDISYMGLLHIAQQSGSIQWGQCKIVYENDAYESTGIDTAPSHKYNAFSKERGRIVGAYCVVQTASGAYLTEEMAIDEILSIRDSSPSYKSGKSSPWDKYFSEMVRKTVIKRASKYWPKSDRLDNAIEYLNTDGGEGIVIDNPPQQETIIDDPIESIERSLAAQGKSEAEFVAWAAKQIARKYPDRVVVTFEDLTSAELVQFAKKMEAIK